MKHPEPVSMPSNRFYDSLLSTTTTTIVSSVKALSQSIVSVSVIVLLLSGQLPLLLLFLQTPLSPIAVNNAYADHFNPDKISISDLTGSVLAADNSDDDDEDEREQKKYDPKADMPYYHNLTQYSYVLYYGQFDSSVTAHILSTKPTLLITNYYAIGQDARELFAENNITIIAYLPISWTHRDIDSTLDEVQQLLDDGADGIFVDEAATMSNDWELWYHGQIYKAAKDYGEDKIVIINPGSTLIDERSMLVADIICFEHDWPNFHNVEWALNYPGWRFMGISSNEFYKVMGYNVDKQSAHQDLEEARHMNIAYHYSADHYIWLPPWLDVYGGIAGSPHPVSDYSQFLDLDSIEHTRPVPYYPIITTETGEVGNDYDSTIIEESPKEQEKEEEEADEDSRDADNGKDEDDPAEQQPIEGSEQEEDEQKEEPPSDSDSDSDNNDGHDSDDSPEESSTETNERETDDSSNHEDSKEHDDDDSDEPNNTSNSTNQDGNSTNDVSRQNGEVKNINNATSLNNDSIEDYHGEDNDQSLAKEENSTGTN